MIQVNVIRAQLALHCMTQKELAKELGMSEKTLCIKLKTGNLGLEDVKHMIEILDIEDPIAVFLS